MLGLALSLAGGGLAPGVARAGDDASAAPAPDDFQPAPDPKTRPGPDATLFGEAADLQGKGRYVEARRRFWRLLDEYPDSPYAPEARDRSDPNAFLGVTRMTPAAPASNRIDVALMGDGYLLSRQDRFDKAAVAHLKVLLHEPVFAEYASYFAFWRFNLASQETGVDEVEAPPADEEEAARLQKHPRRVRTFSTALDCKAAGPQGQVMASPERVAHYLSYLPENDGLALVFARLGQLGMGGMGIATTAPRGVVVHEFGHAFAGLLDEYAIYPGEPSGQVDSANTTTRPDRPPWQHFLDHKVPGVGVYEGGATFQKGVWRPAVTCAMNTGGGAYCPVCREATLLTIYTYVSPIDQVTPDAKEVVRGPDGWPPIEVVPMQPATHDLEVEFRLGPAPEVTPKTDPGDTPEDRFGDELLTPAEREMWKRIQERRKAEGRSAALPELLPSTQRRRAEGTAGDPPPPGDALRSRRRHDRERGVDVVTPVLPDLAPGRWLLTVRVQDDARPRGAKFPWVLRDPRGLLEARHAWILVVPAP